MASERTNRFLFNDSIKEFQQIHFGASTQCLCVCAFGLLQFLSANTVVVKECN